MAGAALVATPMVTAIAQDAATPANMNVAAASVTTPQVQFVDAQNRTPNDARILAAAASTDQIAIVVWGGNRTIQQEAYNAARDLVGMGIPAAFVLAPDDNGLVNDAALQVYAASLPRSDGRMGTDNAQYVRADMREAGIAAYREAFPAQLAQLSLR